MWDFANERPVPLKNPKVRALADCIRDGIELAYPNWDAWQFIARETLRQHAPEMFKDLDSYKTVVKGER